MTPLQELLIHALEREQVLVIDPEDDGVCAALEALVRCVRYRAAEGIGT